ncbi:hypothetical protein [Nonomuraea roseola]|uniref:Class I SAM-dependent methyltransferase n=1 Tax=Nonomuraea roseola TaxID=46179 RepID=A0ABV5QFX1_9ACTN
MTDLSYLAAVRESYDTVAAAYVEQVMTPAELDPLSRAMLAAFTETVRTAGRRAVADVGCGPGRVTAAGPGRARRHRATGAGARRRSQKGCRHLSRPKARAVVNCGSG